MLGNNVLFRGNLAVGFGEVHRSHLAVDLGAERGGDGVQARGGDFLEVALFDFLLEALELAGEDFPALVALTEDALGEALGFGGAEVGDFELVLRAPLDEGGLGDVELKGNAILHAQTTLCRPAVVSPMLRRY